MTQIKAVAVKTEMGKHNLLKLNILSEFFFLVARNFVHEIYVVLSPAKSYLLLPFLSDALSVNSNTHLSKSVRKGSHANHLYDRVILNKSASFP